MVLINKITRKLIKRGENCTGFSIYTQINNNENLLISGRKIKIILVINPETKKSYLVITKEKSDLNIENCFQQKIRKIQFIHGDTAFISIPYQFIPLLNIDPEIHLTEIEHHYNDEEYLKINFIESTGDENE